MSVLPPHSCYKNMLSVTGVRHALTSMTSIISGSGGLLFKEKSNTFIQQGCIKMIKSESKDIYNGTKDLYELSINENV